MGTEVALISLFSAVVGIVLSNGLSTLIDIKRRHTRRLDIICALHAEISAGISANQRQLSNEERTYILEDESPFGTPDETDFVFETIKNDLSILPLEVIHPIVQYYRMTMQSNLMTRDLRSDDFKIQPKAAKQKFVAALLDVANEQSKTGLKALSFIELYAQKYSFDLTEKRSSRTDTLKPKDE